MATEVLYRKWRPQRFAEIAGQDPIVRTLCNAVAQGKTAHAYLFTGPRGTGKTSTGRILAKALNCLNLRDGDACGTCESCRAIEEGRALDLVEVDAASNRGIDNIRDLRERANYVPSSARVKVYLIDEVHQLTGPAADALLKTLEEPPPHVVFILATTDPEALKATVLSRCQRFDFRRVGVEPTRARLRTIAEAEGIQIPDEALDVIAREATGSLRDAVNLLDQAVATHGATVSAAEVVASLGLSTDARALELARAALTRDLKRGLGIIAAVQDDAVDMVRFNRQVVHHLRRALLIQTGAADLLALSEPEMAALRALSSGVAETVTLAALRAFGTADTRADPYQALPLELALAQVVLGPAVAEPGLAPPGLAPPGMAPQPAAAPQMAREGASASRPPQRRERPASSDNRPPSRQARPPAPSSRPMPGAESGPPPLRPPAASPPPPRDLSPAEEALQSLRAALKAQNEHALAAYLNASCRLIDGGGDTVTLAFFPTYVNLHLAKVREQRALVGRVASAVLGRAVTVDCRPDTPDTEAEGAPRRPSLAEAAEALGAKVVSKRPR